MISTSLFICGIWTVVTGTTHVIHKSVQTSIAGDNVTLYCRLEESYDVVQVTWQKEHGKEKTNIATYSTTHGSKVLGEYQNHLYLSQSGLKVSTITFHAVTIKDEGCYRCIFNTFPLGSMPGRTCLRVYALMKPKVDMKRVTSPDSTGKEILEISCSVTGKPAPVITWKFPEHLEIKPSQYFTHHPNQTVTVVSNFTHISSKDVWKNPITCVIHHPSLNTNQELTLPENEMEQAKRKVPRIPILASLILTAMFILGLLTFLVFNYWRTVHTQDEKQNLLMVLPICSEKVACGKYCCTRKQVRVKPLHQEDLRGG